MALEESSAAQSRRLLLLADYLVIAYSLYLIVIGFLFYAKLEKPMVWLSMDFCLLVLLVMLIERNRREPRALYAYLHFGLPLISFGIFYTQSTLWDNVFIAQTFDSLLQKWDKLLFGVHLNNILAPAIHNVLVDELMHFFYFSYYLIIFLPALLMFRQRNRYVFEMVFTVTLMYYVHYFFFMLFPSDGPIYERHNLFQHGYLFIPIMNAIYTYSGQQGGGAFPSTHVTSAVIIFIYTYKYFKPIQPLMYLLCGGIIIATVYCSYHYAIDSLAGLISGTIFYFIGSYLYRRLCPVPESAFPVEAQQLPTAVEEQVS